MIPILAKDEFVRRLVRQWMTLLAQNEYEAALELFFQGEINPYGLNPEYAGLRWNADVLRQSIWNAGFYDDEISEENSQVFKVAEITDVNETFFESDLNVEWIDSEKQKTWGLDPKVYAGIVHVGIPLKEINTSTEFNDITARILMRKIDNHNVALELLDIHVM